MNTPLSWIKAYVPGLSCTDQEYNDRMTMTGTKVDGMYRTDKNLENIVVGRIVDIQPHPDADKLVVCKVDVGSEAAGNETGCIQIVTGAPNVETGQTVPVVLSGGKVAGGHDGSPNPEDGIKIKAGKLRGVESAGMMCSIEELGSSRDYYPEAPENGIYVFTGDDLPAVGSDAVEALGLHETVFEYEITSNRVDCYSVLGIAREAAATFDLPFEQPRISFTETDENTADMIDVEIRDADLCSRYCARVCTDVKIAPSPKWMQRRLAAAGIRPINNLVDITNYVMLEYGQPMHAYDLDRVAGHKIIVRRANDGDVFQTLDEQDRKLDKDVLMICDAEKEIGIAGIMGGENTKITDDVKTVLFEAACFHGSNIRKSAKRIGLRTEASSMFEKGLDPVNALEAINRACQLMEELGCGRVAKGVVDVCSPIKPLVRIPFSAEKINAYLGTDYSEDVMMDIFRKLEFGYDPAKGELIIPTFRQDVLAMCDIAEEVARFTGYDNIPTTLPKSAATFGGLTFNTRVENIARSVARSYGFSEAMNYSFESRKVYDKLLLPEDAKERSAIRISNPLGEDFAYMRTTTLNGMLTNLSTNYNRRNKDVRLFEIANVYLPKALPLTELPDEEKVLSLGFYGEGDFYTLKGTVEELMGRLGMKDRLVLKADAGVSYLHPGRQAELYYNGSYLGVIGEVHPVVLKNYEIGERAYIAQLMLRAFTEETNLEPHYDGIARYPAMTRDLSMLVPSRITAGELEDVFRTNGGSILESYRLFDLYEGAQIASGYKSIAYSLTFRHKERTLEEQEVAAAMEKILAGLKEIGVELRA
ncbi:MAG: phenylalanine--tRNA ligase subunit beta [Lachnospiraceae bacterium]|nr:phenylalanine--tRNA ligase subunit beta [Lachnospiraceae bacterium]